MFIENCGLRKALVDSNLYRSYSKHLLKLHESKAVDKLNIPEKWQMYECFFLKLESALLMISEFIKYT